MFAPDLLPRLAGLHVRHLDVTPDLVTVDAETTTPTVACPHCQTPSHRVQSRYLRTLADKPLVGLPLRLRVTVRRFVCGNADCPRTIFTEALDALAPPRARTTAALTEAHTAIGFAAGGEPGSRLAHALDLPTSPDTLLRRVKAAALDPGPPPRYVGVDDWAIRKGQVYGTMIVDLERSRVVALLPGRDGDPLAEWLRNNPQVEVITRDRWPAYAKAATDAAPQAMQVADRWHLLKNLREAVEDLLARFAPEIRAAAPSGAVTPELPPATAALPPVESPTRTSQEARRRARRERRQQVRELRAEGGTIRTIAKHLRMSRRTVIEILRGPDRPHGSRGRRGPSALDAYRVEIESWLASGATNTAELYRMLKDKGLQASYDAVRRYANRRLGSSGKRGRRSSTNPLRPAAAEVPSPRKLSFQFVCPKPPVDGVGPSLLDRVRSRLPSLDVVLKVAGELADMIRRKVATPLAEWIAKAAASGSSELARFASGLRADAAAVAAALTASWSKGPVEGQVNRLKAIKRGMYGRAGLDLLRARVLRKG